MALFGPSQKDIDAYREKFDIPSLLNLTDHRDSKIALSAMKALQDIGRTCLHKKQPFRIRLDASKQLAVKLNALLRSAQPAIVVEAARTLSIFLSFAIQEGRDTRNVLSALTTLQKTPEIQPMVQEIVPAMLGAHIGWYELAERLVIHVKNDPMPEAVADGLLKDVAEYLVTRCSISIPKEGLLAVALADIGTRAGRILAETGRAQFKDPSCRDRASWAIDYGTRIMDGLVCGSKHSFVGSNCECQHCHKVIHWFTKSPCVCDRCGFTQHVWDYEISSRQFYRCKNCSEIKYKESPSPDLY